MSKLATTLAMLNKLLALMVKNHLQASPAFAALPGKDLQIIKQTNLFIAFIQLLTLPTF